MNYRGAGRRCPTCGRGQYEHDGGKPNRGCNLRLVSLRTMRDHITGEVVPFEAYVPDSPYPRTAADPRAWVQTSSLEAQRREV